jgi:hypothetical protein
MSHSPIDDAQSVGSKGSTLSSSNEKVPCPHCKGELQLRAMFNHFRTKHPQQFDDMIDSNWMKNSKPELPIKIWWEMTNDFDEKESQIIYGCLSTGKTFQKIEKGIQHFKKNKTAHTDHIAQFKERNRLYLQERAAKLGDHNQDPFKKALLDQDPYLARCLYSRILFLAPQMERLMSKIKNFYPLEGESFTDGFVEFSGSRDCILRYDAATETLEKYLQSKELDPQKLIPILTVFEKLTSVGFQLKMSAGHFPYGSGSGGKEYFYIGHPMYPQVHF